jgi:radical SAM superfamily enzyme YgiQ (UPF0313 family)
MDFSEPLFRPPSEAYSLILQPTIGCSWNKCAFCEMYSRKKFRIRPLEDTIDQIKELKDHSAEIRKVFLADGNALVLKNKILVPILKEIRNSLPNVRRVSAYALPSDILRKSKDELKELYDLGLKLLYVGIESGDDVLLKLIDKGETYRSTVDGLVKAQEAGMQNSVMILTGLGGKKYSEQHAVNSAKAVSEVNPDFVSTLVLSFPYGVERYKEKFLGEYCEMDTVDILKELKLFIENVDLHKTIFRSDHASNYLELKGILGKDKNRLLSKLDFAIDKPKQAGLRPEWMRGL